MRSVHLVKRANVPNWKKRLNYLLAFVFAIGVGAVFLSFLGINPIDYYKEVVTIGLIGNRYPGKCIEGLLKILIPLLITSLSLALSFRMRFWNIGGEGQFLIGAIVSATVAYKFSYLPTLALIILMSLSAMLASGIVGLIVAFFKVKFNTNETLFTLMINYIVLYFLHFLGETKADWNFFLNQKSARPIFDKLPKNAWMPKIKIGDFNLLYSYIIAAILTVLIYFYIKKTKHGYELVVVGNSSNTAKYAGMKVAKIVLRTMFISAALIGLAGAFSASTAQTISTEMTNRVGWTGIVVAWISKLSIPVIVRVVLLISILQWGCQVASTAYPSLDSNFADILQSLILFIILVADFSIRFKIAFRKDGIEVNSPKGKKSQEVADNA